MQAFLWLHVVPCIDFHSLERVSQQWVVRQGQKEPCVWQLTSMTEVMQIFFQLFQNIARDNLPCHILLAAFHDSSKARFDTTADKKNRNTKTFLCRIGRQHTFYQCATGSFFNQDGGLLGLDRDT
jgi:hypothetical protein